MADDKGRPIHAAPPAAPAAHAPTDPERPKGCLACGRFHGSVGVHIACMGFEILRLRAEVRRLGAKR